MSRLNRSKTDDNRLRLLGHVTAPDHIIGMAWSPDGRHLAAATVSGPVVVVNAQTRTPVATLAGHKFGTTAVAWKPTGDVLSTAGQDGVARLWDTTLWQERAALAGGAAWVEHVAFSPYDSRLGDSRLATAAGKKLRIWNATTGDLLHEHADHASTIADVVWRPTGDRVSVAAYGGITAYHPAAADSALAFAWKGAPLKHAWSPDGRMLAHGNQDATVHFWFTHAPTDPFQMSGYSTKVRELSWDFSSRWLACGGSPVVCLWDCSGPGPAGRKPVLLQKHDGPLTAVAWQRRGFLLASAAVDGAVKLWQPANKRGPEVGRYAGAAAVSVVAWSPDDTRLAVGGDDGTVTILAVV